MIEPKKFKNPFPGLRPFETDEYRLFFGREGQSDALINCLQRSRLLAVVGTSGSGKSSLVRAGLLPALRGGMMAGGSGWRIAIMRPGSDPFSNLAGALVEKDVIPEAGGGLPPAEAKAVIEAMLRRGSLGLVDAVSQGRLAQHEKLLIVVDQFEELFRFRAARATTSTGDDASAFVKLLLEAASQTAHSIYIVLTMRSDFLGDCAQFQGLPEAINDGQYLIPRMTRDERRIAITGPIGVARGRMAEPLVSRLLNDVGDNPDQLPILQHALMRTWDYWAANRRDGEPLGLQHYYAIGTMDRALSVHADEAFEILDDRSKRIAELLFKCLTERGADNREIRRPTRISEICDIAGDSFEDVSAVVEVFRYEGCSFLMPPEGVPLTSETVVDISHESLIRNWDRLQKWVDEEAQSSRIYRRLSEAAVLHREGSEGLLKNPALQIALDWREQHKPNAAWARRYNPEFAETMAFLDASKAAHEAELAEEEREREEQLARDRRELEMARVFADKQARSARRMRWLAAGMAVMFLLSVITAGIAFVAWQRTESQKAAIELQSATIKKTLDQKELADRERDAAEKVSEQARADREAALKQALNEKERAESEAKRANENFQKAEIARKTAVENEKQVIAAVQRGEVLRNGIEAFRREHFDKALDSFQQLREELTRLQPRAIDGAADLSTIQSRQYASDLGWTLSNMGATFLKTDAYEKAVDSYEKALKVFEQTFPADSDDPIVYDTYDGLANSYYKLAGHVGPTAAAHSKREQDLKNAETFFQRALEFQRRHGKNPAAEAAEHLKLGRLYVEYKKIDEAEKSFKQAITNLRLGKATSDLKPLERAALVSAFRELGEFYQRWGGRTDGAIATFNEMITVQEDINVDDLVSQGNEIAISYSDLGQIHWAIADAARALAEKTENPERKQAVEKDAAFHSRKYEDLLRIANLLQRTSLRLRQMEKLGAAGEGANVQRDLAAELDELGDAYLKIDKPNDAEALYVTALGHRDGAARAISYRKLIPLYLKQKKNYDQAELYSQLLIQLYSDKPRSTQYANALTQLAVVYAEANRFSEAESTYKQALDIYAEKSDWWYENLVLFRLSRLYEKSQRVAEREQALKARVETLTKYFNQLSNPAGPLPKDPVTLVSEYLYAVNALGYFYAKNGRNADAEAAYGRALAAHDYIARNIYNEKILTFYSAVLGDYQQLLKNQDNKAEAGKVAERRDDVRRKLVQDAERKKQETAMIRDSSSDSSSYPQ